MVKIVIDSTCDLPEEYMKLYDIKSLPLRILLGDKEYSDKVTIQVEEVYDEMRKGVVPKTSQVSAADMYKVFTKYCEEKQDFIYLSFSSVLSGTHDVAKLIIEELKEKYHDCNMEVIDSKGGALGTGLIALQAARMGRTTDDFEAIKKEIEFMVEHVEHVFTLDDLDWLIKGGRISKAVGVVGGVLDIKPIMHVDNGYLKVIKTSRGRKKSINTLINMVEERSAKFPSQIIGISHADDLETAKEIEAKLKANNPNRKFIIQHIGSVLGSHLGLGGVGILFLNEKPEFYDDSL